MNKKRLAIIFIVLSTLGALIYIRFAEDYGYPPVELPQELSELEIWAKDPEIATSLYSILISIGFVTYLAASDTHALTREEGDPYKKFEETMAKSKRDILTPYDFPTTIGQLGNKGLKRTHKTPSGLRSLTTGRYAITDREKVEEYYRTLGPHEIAELRKYGADYFPASKSWRIPPDLSHLPKELVWSMLVESYNDMMRPGWREKIEYKTKKGIEWLFS